MDFKYTSLQPLDLCNNNKKIIGKFYVKVSNEGIFLQGKEKSHLLSNKRPINTDYDDTGKTYCSVSVIKAHQEGIGESAFIVFNDSNEFSDFTMACYDIEETFENTEIVSEIQENLDEINAEQPTAIENEKNIETEEKVEGVNSNLLIDDVLALENTYFLNLIFGKVAYIDEKLSEINENEEFLSSFAEQISQITPYLMFIQNYLPNIFSRIDKEVYYLDESESLKTNKEYYKKWLNASSLLNSLISKFEALECVFSDICEDYSYSFPVNFTLTNLSVKFLYCENTNGNFKILSTADIKKNVKRCRQEWNKIKFLLPAVVNGVMSIVYNSRKEYYIKLFKTIAKTDEDKLTNALFIYQSNLLEALNEHVNGLEMINNGELAEKVINITKESEFFINRLTYSFNKQ